MYAFVGSFNYQGAKPEGITSCEYHPEDGTITIIESIAPQINSGSLTLRGNRIYSTDEQVTSCEQAGGGVYTFDIDLKNGKLIEKSHIFTMAANTSGVTFDNTGRYMIVTHFAIGKPCIKVKCDGVGSWHSEKIYHDAITSLYSVDEEGIPEKLCDVFIHPVTSDGRPSIIHRAFLAPKGNLFAYGNLGADRIGFFRIDYENEKLCMIHEVKCKEYSGPRHLAFHPTLPYLYLNYERNGVISRFQYSNSECIHLDDIDILPKGTEMDMSYNQSEILVNSQGSRLYNLIRGLGILYVMKINPKDGKLSILQMVSLESRVARGAAFSPDGRFLLVACNDTQNIETYEVLADGSLEKASVSEKIKHPASIVFLTEQALENKKVGNYETR